MKDTYIFAIESSCDETACSIVKNGNDYLVLNLNMRKVNHGIFEKDIC